MVNCHVCLFFSTWTLWLWFSKAEPSTHYSSILVSNNICHRFHRNLEFLMFHQQLRHITLFLYLPINTFTFHPITYPYLMPYLLSLVDMILCMYSRIMTEGLVKSILLKDLEISRSINKWPFHSFCFHFHLCFFIKRDTLLLIILWILSVSTLSFSNIIFSPSYFRLRNLVLLHAQKIFIWKYSSRTNGLNIEVLLRDEKSGFWIFLILRKGIWIFLGYGRKYEVCKR